MMKIVLLTLALCTVALADTSFELRTSDSKTVVDFDGEISKPEGPVATSYYVPPDNGGNWGDNIWRTRIAGDSKVSSEIQINPIKPQEQQFNWNANFPGRQITHIRFLNIGRQRAYVESVVGNGGSSASAVVRISPNQQFRLLIEVYAK